MTKHFQTEMLRLKRRLLALAAVVEQSLERAVKAIESRNKALAEEVIAGDDEIDRMEVELEEECLKIIALYQPVAIDLRTIIAALKINNNLERVGDLAQNIAERAAFIATRPPASVSPDLRTMAHKAQAMLRKSIDALVKANSALAREVLADDEEIDAMNRRMYALLQEAMRRYPEEIEVLVQLLSTSRHLERVADHATNIAEDVIYLLEGEIVRHRPSLSGVGG